MPTPATSCRSKLLSLIDARGPAGQVAYSAVVQHAGALCRVSVALDLHDPRRSVAYTLDPQPADVGPVLEALAAELRHRSLGRQQRGDDRAARDREAAERLRLAVRRAPVLPAAVGG